MGSSHFGPWNSCVDFAVIPKCTGELIAKKFHRGGGATIVPFIGRGFDTSCGSIQLNAYGEALGAIPVATYNASSFGGVIRVNGRLCGLELAALQQETTPVVVRLGAAKHVDAIVLFSSPGVLPNGDQIGPGDFLCDNELTHDEVITLERRRRDTPGFDAFMHSLVKHLHQRILSFEVRGAAYAADAAGRVLIFGVAAESVPELFAPAVMNLRNASPAPAANTDAVLAGEAATDHSGPLVLRSLRLDGGVLVVNGDLTINGSVTGLGSIYALGNVTIRGRVDLSSQGQNAIIAGGRLNLP
jgi:hypothetical protein